MKKRRVVVNDLMQSKYVYFCTEPIGKNFHPDFQPELTPGEMLELGVFGGKYMTDCVDEFPASWFRKAKLSPRRRNAKLNYFGINASVPLSVWRKKGWIYHEDPRGWFQWYFAVTTWGGDVQTTSVRSNVGVPFGVTLLRLRRIALLGKWSAGPNSVRRYYIGPTTLERFE